MRNVDGIVTFEGHKAIRGGTDRRRDPWLRPDDGHRQREEDDDHRDAGEARRLEAAHRELPPTPTTDRHGFSSDGDGIERSRRESSADAEALLEACFEVNPVSHH
jgi:hypothetical protein